MKVIFNSRIVESFEIPAFWTNRAFQYGDSLFETMLWTGSHILRLAQHQERLFRGLDILQIKIPDDLLKTGLQKQVEELFLLERYAGFARLRMQVWRRAGGRYTPLHHDAEWFLSYEPISEPTAYHVIDKAGVASAAFSTPHALSFCKTGSSLTYVLAGLEKKNQQWDEILLTDIHGHIAEASASNVFWVKGSDIFTPSLASGCIAGVRRATIIDFFRHTEHEVTEVLTPIQSVWDADLLFTANAMGLGFIKSLHNEHYLVPGDAKFPSFLQGILHL